MYIEREQQNSVNRNISYVERDFTGSQPKFANLTPKITIGKVYT